MMQPLTPEQVEALATRIEARATKMARIIKNPQPEYATGYDGDLFVRSCELFDLAKELRDGTFIEVQHD